MVGKGKIELPKLWTTEMDLNGLKVKRPIKKKRSKVGTECQKTVSKEPIEKNTDDMGKQGSVD